MNTLHEYAARAVAAGDYVRDWLLAHRDGQTVFERRSQMRRADSARIEATTVDRALADASPEASIQLAGQRDAFVRRIDELRAPGRTLTRPESLELFHLAESVKRIDAATFGAGVLTEHRLAEFGAVGAKRGFLTSLAGGGVMQWVAAGGVAFGLTGFATAAVTGMRLNHAKADLTEARTEPCEQNDERRPCGQFRDALAVNADLIANIRAASQQSQRTAANLEAERQRAQRFAERERRRQRELREVDVGGSPPDWERSLQPDAGSSEGGGPAAPPAPGDRL